MVTGTPSIDKRHRASRTLPGWRVVRVFWLGCLLLLASPAPVAAQGEGQGAVINRARAAMLGLVTALQEERYVPRDSYWSVTLQPQESRLITLHPLQGVNYWVCTGWASEDGKVRIGLYNEQGNPVLPDSLAEGNNAVGAQFRPTVSGRHYVRITNIGSAPATVSLTYCYR